MNSSSAINKAQPVDADIIHTVLLVEDETMVRMPIAEFLRDCGYNVVEASDAAEAMAAVDTVGSVSVVFSDVRMPGAMDGLGLAAWFKSHHPEVPVLLTSGYIASLGVKADSLSGCRLIEKPYSQIQVARRIAALLDS